MSLQTPAIADIRLPIATGTFANALRGIGIRQVRIASGLVMFLYINTHFFNHTLGNISYDLMEWWMGYHVWWWRIPVVNGTLYAAAAIHFCLGIWALYQRRHFRYTGAELTQLILGLSIPILIASHFGAARMTGLLFDRPPPAYSTILFNYWNVRTYNIAVQYALMTVAWTHACIGIYFWLRLKPFFRWAAPFLLGYAVLLPPLAMLGAHHGAMEVTRRAADPAWRREHVRPVTPAQRVTLDDFAYFYVPLGYLGLLGLVFVARGVRSLVERRRGVITLTYPDRKVRVPKGLSVLEASLRHRVPHASVCGGRARCSTCRIRVVSDRRALPRPSGREVYVLSRVGASDPSIRLACQLRPASDLAFIPIFPTHLGADFVRKRGRISIGEEHYIVSMFVDMRGSTKLAEARLPFDTLFLVNRFLGAASEAVVTCGGQPNQFVGDGLLALFGLDVDSATACRQALRAAAMVASNVEYLNHQFASDLNEPIQYGIGIHGGDVIVGDIGYRDRTVFTALGDAVNVAARLQDMTKSLNCKIIVSEDVCRSAGVAAGFLRPTEVSIRGREAPMAVRTAEDPTVLSSLLDDAMPEEREPLKPAAE
ncbi:MAG: adenylate/guanylate cyclase domain-containing protein [Xanthobacteraceae bacterium]